jgi:type II secretory pathway component PulK
MKRPVKMRHTAGPRPSPRLRRTEPSSRRSGVALMLVLLSLALLTILSVEIITASRVELKIGRNAKERMQAYYLAQSGARFNILRLYMYKEVKNLAQSQSSPIPVTPDQIDGIWSLPLPDLPMEGMKDVKWPGKVSGIITSEGSKIPINLLDGNRSRGSDPTIADEIRTQLKNLIEGLLAQEEFDAKYRGLKPDDLINPLQDWIDEDNESRSGGRDEGAAYEKADPPYKPRNGRIPVLSELNMIENWSDDIVRRIAPQLTVLSNRRRLNPNFVSLERLRTFEPKLTTEDLNVIEAHRITNPFTSLEQMADFIRTEQKIPNGRDFKFPNGMKFEDRESVFYVNGTGQVGDSTRTVRVGIKFKEEKTKAATPPPPPPPPGGEQTPADGTTPTTTEPKPGKLLQPEVIMAEEIV